MNCPSCKKEKVITKFSKGDSRCKKCLRIKARKYAHSIAGVISHMYASQKTSSKKRGMVPPNYTKVELSQWLHSKRKFHKHFEKWVSSGYDRMRKPSCDRVDSLLPYRFDNLKVVSFKKNCENNVADTLVAYEHRKYSKVIQMTMDGIEVAKYKSMNIASRATSVNQQNISSVCRGLRNHAGGFIWRYDD